MRHYSRHHNYCKQHTISECKPFNPVIIKFIALEVKVKAIEIPQPVQHKPKCHHRPHRVGKLPKIHREIL